MKGKNIFGQKVKYIIKDLSDSGSMGQWDSINKIIYLDKSLEGRELLMTMIHEELHAVFSRIFCQAYIDPNMEETIVHCIETYLFENYEIKSKNKGKK